MARTKAVLGAGARLTDYLSASLLARVIPSEAIHATLERYGRNSQRLRSLPAVSGVYYCMALSLYPEAAYEEVFAAVAQGLAWAQGAQQPQRMAKSSISGVRERIGFEPLRDLVHSQCKPLAQTSCHPQAFYAGLRVVAIDGSNFELADEPANAQAFGRPGSRTGFAAYPQAQCAVLVECATHAILAAHLGPYRDAEWKICQPLLPYLDASMLLLADRGFRGHGHWVQAKATGAQLLWRMQDNQMFPVVRALPDGSYLSVLYPSTGAWESRRAQAQTVRVIEYALPDQAEPTKRYRLLTTLLDASQAPALELAALYHQRWQIEQVFDELKTHLSQGRRVFRSKTPDLVRQEFYAWVLAHYAVRWLLHAGAAKHRLAHAQLSFKAHVQLLKREQPRSGSFPPEQASAEEAVV
jgi:hypothetical protein